MCEGNNSLIHIAILCVSFSDFPTTISWAPHRGYGAFLVLCGAETVVHFCGFPPFTTIFQVPHAQRVMPSKIALEVILQLSRDHCRQTVFWRWLIFVCKKWTSFPFLQEEGWESGVPSFQFVYSYSLLRSSEVLYFYHVLFTISPSVCFARLTVVHERVKNWLWWQLNFHF
jgi:hypothetical protein